MRCGDPLLVERQRATTFAAGRRGGQFAAAPEESAVSLHLSTLFPQLPRGDMGTFQLVLGIGLAAIVGLAIVGVYPVAFAAALVLVPLMMVLYMWDVDVYEDEPFRVIGYTAGWGIVTGLIAGLLIRAFVPLDIGAFGSITTETLVVRGVVIPLLGGVVMLAGPLVLLPYRKFNDVLDGATFGATAAVTFVAAQSFAQAVDLFAGGIRPAGDPLPWVVRLVALGIANPVIAAGRDRIGCRRVLAPAPARRIADRHRLGTRRTTRRRDRRRRAAPRCGGCRPARAPVRRGPRVARAAGGDRDDLAAGGDPPRACCRKQPRSRSATRSAARTAPGPRRSTASAATAASRCGRFPRAVVPAHARTGRLCRPDARVTTATRPPGRSPFRVLLTFVVALGVVLLVAGAVAVALTPAAPPPDCPDPNQVCGRPPAEPTLPPASQVAVASPVASPPGRPLPTEAPTSGATAAPSVAPRRRRPSETAAASPTSAPTAAPTTDPTPVPRHSRPSAEPSPSRRSSRPAEPTPRSRRPRRPSAPSEAPSESPSASPPAGPSATPGIGFVVPAPRPASDAAPYRAGTVWRSSEYGFSFEYDADIWTINDESPRGVQLLAARGNVSLCDRRLPGR